MKLSEAEVAADPPRIAASVRGLGVCDALRIVLAPCQHPTLVAAIEHRAAALDEAPHADLDQLRADWRALARVQATVPERPASAFVFIAPTGLALELVSACLRAAIADLGESASTGRLEAAAAWISTSLDCRAVEQFCFEPEVDPVHAG